MKLCAGELESILCRLWNLSCRAVKVWGTVVLRTPVITGRSVHTVEGFDSWLSPLPLLSCMCAYNRQHPAVTASLCNPRISQGDGDREQEERQIQAHEGA